MTSEIKIDRVTVYQAADGGWCYAAWMGTEHDHNGEIPDAETQAEAVANMEATWPAATVSVVDAGDAGADAPGLEVSRYSQDGTAYICVGDADTATATARTAAESALRPGERLADDMERIDGCCTWTVIAE